MIVTQMYIIYWLKGSIAHLKPILILPECNATACGLTQSRDNTFIIVSGSCYCLPLKWASYLLTPGAVIVLCCKQFMFVLSYPRDIEAVLSVIVCNCLLCVNIITKRVLASSVRKKKQPKARQRNECCCSHYSWQQRISAGIPCERTGPTGYYGPSQGVSQILWYFNQGQPPTELAHSWRNAELPWQGPECSPNRQMLERCSTCLLCKGEKTLTENHKREKKRKKTTVFRKKEKGGGKKE